MGWLVRVEAHDVAFPHEVLRGVEYFVEVGRQRVEVFGVDRRRERVAQGAPQLALLIIGSMLARPYDLDRGVVATGPRDEPVHGLDGDRGLLAQHRQHVGALGTEPVLRAHVSHLQGNRASAAPMADAGRVTSQASSIARTTGQ